MQVVKATTSDMPQVIELLKIILDEMELPFYLNNDQNEVTKLFTKTFQSKTYTNDADVLVAKVDNQVAGLAFGYPGKNEDVLDDEFQKHFDQVNIPAQEIYEDPEADADEWYLDSLVVNPEFQNQGIGTTLLNAIPKFAKQRGLTKVGLLVDDLNPNAERLYRRIGFRDDHEQVVSNHHYKHLKLDL
ncbi:GNAT family N-acetyltransferase [Pediococcus stilesii]|uniref:Acetyltransferase n=1 Tax=Pediococcus stilesii TaxID=331679 RepID=A0A0R2KZ37_9LACO|nr:GNAT family N-acetyltransferase [Pediococcus stilesii]KRN94793.1 acetyltransferase [Pediococcus stilesii]